MMSRRFTLLLLPVKDWVEGRVVVHLHLAIDLHDSRTRCVIRQQLADRGGHILQLFAEYRKFLGALFMLLGTDIGTVDLLLHVVNLHVQDAQAVDSPCGALGVDFGIRLRLDVVVLFPEIGVDALHKVSAFLIAAVDTPLECQCLHGVYLGVANDVLEVPLHGVNPVLEVQVMLNGSLRVGVVNGSIDVVRLVIILHRGAEDAVAEFYKIHISLFIVCYG